MSHQQQGTRNTNSYIYKPQETALSEGDANSKTKKIRGKNHIGIIKRDRMTSKQSPFESPAH